VKKVEKKILAVSLFASVLLLVVLVVARASERSRRIHLPTSKALTLPVPGYLARTNSFPATIALSPDGRYAALLNQGYGTQETGARQSIAILDLSNNQLRDFPDNRLSDDYSTRQSYFIGLAFSSDGKHLYASMGSVTDPTGQKPTSTGNGIAVYKFSEGEVSPERFIKIAPQPLAEGKEVAFGLRKTLAGTAIPYPAGFAVLPNPNGDRLLIANNLSDNAIVLDTNSGKILQFFDLSQGRYIPSAYPYTVIANKAGTRAWVTLWNTSAVAELNLQTGKVTRWIDVLKPGIPITPGSHPTAMVLNQDEQILYVAVSNADEVVALDVNRGAPLRLFHTTVSDDHSSSGSVPLAISLSFDGSRLYVANASLDAVAVYDTSSFKEATEVLPLGLIPTEWYPSALAIAGNNLLIATAKGESSGPNNMQGTLKGERKRKEHPYIPTLIGGSIARLSLADIDKNLAAYTHQVEEDNLLRADVGKFTFAGGSNPIRHVIYVLKENRTYDQVLGDLPVGDADSSLTMYGKDITPNEHKLALQFGVLDNFYDSGEVSGDGHLWSTASTTSDYNEKNWPIAYRSKERPYDFGGSVAEEFPLEQGIRDVDDPATGFLWDNLARCGLTYRVYGEFIAAVWCKSAKIKSTEAGSSKEGTISPISETCPVSEIKQGDPLPVNVGNPRGGPSPWPWPIPQMKRTRPTKAALRDHYDPQFPDFNVDYPDQLRADEFLREFDEFVKAKGTAAELPQFTLLYLPDDHTGGTRPGKPAPQASVADNDLALGRVVDAVSHSAYWDDTAIFVLEDDAQDGADHVDAHRSTAFVISKYAPRSPQPMVDHRFYTTVSVIHTMEALLNLPPMNLFDAHAPLMTELFSAPASQPPYQVDDSNLRNGLIYKINQKTAAGAKESSQMNFSKPDAVDAKKLNAILWQDAKVSPQTSNGDHRP
jgi:DNA-binding beta-propeller fold protein YncE